MKIKNLVPMKIRPSVHFSHTPLRALAPQCWHLGLLLVAGWLHCMSSAFAFPVKLDPGDYAGVYLLSPGGTGRFTGAQTFELAPGTYFLDTGAQMGGAPFSSYFTFAVDASGQVTDISNPAAARAIGSTLVLNTASITIDPADYSGVYVLSAFHPARWQGAQTVKLVPGLLYGIDNGTALWGPTFYSTFYFAADASGQVRDISNPPAARGSGGILIFNTTKVAIVPVGYTGGYSLSAFGWSRQFLGNQTVALIPNLLYSLLVSGQFETFVPEIAEPNPPFSTVPCQIVPSQLLLNGVTFMFSCVAEHPPVANAGADQTVPLGASCAASVTLDGTGSSDPDGDALTYIWREGNVALGTGSTPTVQLGLGAHEIVLVVDDGKGGAASDTVVVTVADDTPPVLSLLGANPLLLECHEAFNDPGATADDGCAGVLTPAIQVLGSVNSTAVGTYVLTYSVNDGHGNIASAVRTVRIVDTTPPTITCPANITLPCSVDLWVPVSFAAAASDHCDPIPTVSYSKPPGSGFPVGSTTVTCTATDASGNAATCSFTVTRAPLGFDGFLSPIGGADATGGSFSAPKRTFKMNSTIPVKFTASCNGSVVLTGVHRLQVIKTSADTTSDLPIDATPQGGATAGNQFELTDGEWHFNLDTKATGMTTGIWLLAVTLSDGSQHTAWIQLK